MHLTEMCAHELIVLSTMSDVVVVCYGMNDMICSCSTDMMVVTVGCGDGYDYCDSWLL